MENYERPTRPTQGKNQMLWIREEIEKPKEMGSYTLEDVEKHKEDKWIAYKGKVYNIAPYLSFHPGGIRVLESFFGKNIDEGVLKCHPWVNVSFLVEKCQIGEIIKNKPQETNLKP